MKDYFIKADGNETFITPNEEAGEFLKKLTSIWGDTVTSSDVDNLSEEAKDNVRSYCNWNYVYKDIITNELLTKEQVDRNYSMSGYDGEYEEFLEDYYVEFRVE